jgi:hypothetical protein
MASIQNLKEMQIMRYQDKSERQNRKGYQNDTVVNLTICPNVEMIGIEVRR